MSAVVAAAAVLGLLTGCDLFAPQDTKYIHETADGVNGEIRTIFIGNAVLLTADATSPTSLVATLVNQGGSSEHVKISTHAGSQTVTVKPAESVQVGASDGQSVTFDGLGAAPGSLAPVTFEAGGMTETLDVPVLDGSLPQYRDLVP